ncbi:FHA domain-containing protein [Nocardioides jensenii]|uniref:FHA domain-containing protein n=1 Tax=Nocardioides jensenii TaxID=1843 RepID=UPI00082D3A08|nr:FHA domain-containing protein [Nocardioides jensenii]
MTAQWVPGDDHGLIWPAGVALLDGSVGLDTVTRLWERISHVEQLGEFLTALSETLGSGLLGLPAFAVGVGVAEDEGHFAARGRLGAVVGTATGERVAVTGDAMTTWVERHVRRPAEVLLSSGGAVAAGGPRRPVGSGVVPASLVSLGGFDVVPQTVESSGPTPRVSADFISAVPGAPSAVPVTPVPAPGLVPAPSAVDAWTPDHDPENITRIAAKSPPVAPPTAPTAPGGLLAVLCAAGHANPPQRPTCRTCGQGLSDRAVRVPRPSLGRMVVSSGEVLELNGPVVIGRAPRASRFQGADAPRLLTLPHQHISSSHLALRIEDWNVLVVDLGSTNGTFLRRNGKPPYRLSEQPHLVVPGDVVDLGHGVRLRFEELP